MLEKLLGSMLIFGMTACMDNSKFQVCDNSKSSEIKNIDQLQSQPGITLLTLDNYQIQLAATAEVPSVIYTGADWCSPCREFKPEFEKLAKDYEGKVVFFYVDNTKTTEVSRAVQEHLRASTKFVPSLTLVKKDFILVSAVDFTYQSAENLLQYLITIEPRNICGLD